MDFISELAASIAQCANMEQENILPMLETPSDYTKGDFAFPCFKLAGALKKAPPVIAAELSKTIKTPSFIQRVEAVNGYINFFVSPSYFAKRVLDEIRAKKSGYGSGDEGKGEIVCIDYSSINIAKPFHIGHLSSTVIGNSLYRIYAHRGYRPVGINHLGDWGTQFGKLIVAYKNWGNKSIVEKGSIRALLDLYVKYHEEAEVNKALDEEARAWFRRIEDGDKEALSLFEWFKEITLKEVSRVYDMLSITFDSYAGESFYNDKMDRVINELKEKNLLKLDDGAYLVDLEDEKMPPCLILRADGATLYATRDLAAAIYRKDTYDFAKSLYVVAYQQNLHFKQVFEVLKKMGYAWAKNCEHVAFGMVSMQDGTLSTRKGKVLFLEEVLNAAIEKTYAIIQEKSPDLEDKKDVAKKVGVGALVWSALYNNRIKDIVFSFEKALNFDGETGPYVQYTYARCCALLRKASVTDMPDDIDYTALSLIQEQTVLKGIFAFPQCVKDAMEKNEPYMVSRSIMGICSAFNKFYYDCRIIGEEPNIEKARLALVYAVKTVIGVGLHLIGIAAPERM